jgi:hypothetical protein
MAHNERVSKRRKLDNEPQHPDGDIRGAFELHNLLRFQQSADPEVKAGKILQTFSNDQMS